MFVFLLFFLSSIVAIPLNHSSLVLPSTSLEAPGDCIACPFYKIIDGVNRTCFWDGYAPLCGGECGEHYDEIERRWYLHKPEDCVSTLFNECDDDPLFGHPCALSFLTKAMCCRKVKN